MSGYGHNSAAYGETLREEVETVLGDEHQKLFHYVQWHLSDYLTGTKGLTFEFEGAYMRFLANLYDRGKAFPDDDRFMAIVMATDVRKWRRIRKALIEFGKVLVKNGCLTNARFERERIKRAEELRKQAENTRKYWEERRRKREIEQTSTQTSAELLPRSLPEVEEIEAKKVNKNNGSTKHPTSTPRDQRLETKEKKEGSNDPLSSGSGQSDERMTASKAAKIAFDLYNETAEKCGLPKCRILNDARKRALALRVKEAGGIDGFKQALANLEKSAYCQGQNERGWVATIDYVCQPKGFAKLYEGGWGNGKHATDDAANRYKDVYAGVL